MVTVILAGAAMAGNWIGVLGYWGALTEIFL